MNRRGFIARMGATFAEEDAPLDDVPACYGVRRIATDQTGMGKKPVEDAAPGHGTGRVESVLLTAANSSPCRPWASMPSRNPACGRFPVFGS